LRTWSGGALSTWSRPHCGHCCCLSHWTDCCCCCFHYCHPHCCYCCHCFLLRHGGVCDAFCVSCACCACCRDGAPSPWLLQLAPVVLGALPPPVDAASQFCNDVTPRCEHMRTLQWQHAQAGGKLTWHVFCQAPAATPPWPAL
jgi:hypothetical protein